MATVMLQTTMGNITIELNETAAPNTTTNFLQYVQSGFYNGTIFHRVIDGFMVQGGGLSADMSSKETLAPIDNEANSGLKNEIGSIAMARTSDPHSATSQFFININNNDFLDFKSETQDGWGYCVFGKVIDGMDIIKKISQVNTVNRAGHQDVPERDIVIECIEIINTVETVE